MNAIKLLVSTAAAVMVAGAIGFATAQTNSGSTTGTTGGTQSGSTRSANTPTGQMPATTPGMQNQQQNPAPGSMAADPSRRTDTSGTGTMNSRAGSNMNDGTANNRNMNGGMATERAGRADRN